MSSHWADPHAALQSWLYSPSVNTAGGGTEGGGEEGGGMASRRKGARPHRAVDINSGSREGTPTTIQLCSDEPSGSPIYLSRVAAAATHRRSVRPAGDGDEGPPERAPRCLHDPGRRPTGSAAGGGEIS